MAKKKLHRTRVKSKKHLPTLIVLFASFFGVLALAVTITTLVANSQSTVQQVAGASDSGHITSQASCTIMTSVTGYAPCGKDAYKGVSFTCGDGTLAKGMSGQECRSTTAWLAKIAQACAGHSSCRPTGTPTPAFHPNGTSPSTFRRPPTPNPTRGNE